jgi:di/tricarboxylate transporter
VSDRTPTLSWRFAAPIVAWLALLLIPHPTGLSPIAWRYLGLFAGVIVALVLEPLPPAAVGVIGVNLAKVLGDVAPFNRPAEPVVRGRGFPGPGRTHRPG